MRAEAAADDRYAALDLAFAKREGQLRRGAERRKRRRSDTSVRSPEVPAAVGAVADAADGTAVDAAVPGDATAAGLNGAAANGRREHVLPLPDVSYDGADES